MSKILVVYYSLSEKTKVVADLIADLSNADILRLYEKNPMTQAIGKYIKSRTQTKNQITVELEPYNIELDKYDSIIVGTPVWWYTFTPAVRTFLSIEQIRNKKIAFFCTHGGNPRSTNTDMSNLVHKDNEILGDFDLKLKQYKDMTILKKDLQMWLQNIGMLSKKLEIHKTETSIIDA